MAYLNPSPKMQFFDANGAPLVSGKLYTYAAGTLTPLATYIDQAQSGTNTNPVILDSRGEANVWLSTTGLYKWILKDSTDATIWTVDNIGYQYLTANDLYDQGIEIDLASATTTDIGAQNSCFLRITGANNITSLGTNYNGPRYLRFAGTLTITHNASTLILPGSANLTVGAGDVLIVAPKATSGTSDGWYAVGYQKASGFGTAAYLNVGTAANNVVQLNGSAQLPAVDGSLLTGINAAQIQPISASVAASALTISASSLSLDFRSTTLGSGTVTRVNGTPSNLVISSGSTLGSNSGVLSKLAVVAINNAGTLELAVINAESGVSLDESELISTTAEGGAGAADSVSTFYSATARTNVAYRVIGYIESTQATAGTWATAPSKIQGAGAQALERLNSVCSSVRITSTSGTAIDFTGIPNWVKRITVSFYQVSLNSTSYVLVQIGSGSLATSGYTSYAARFGSSTASAGRSSTAGFVTDAGGDAANNFYGTMTLVNQGNNIWVSSHTFGIFAAANLSGSGGGGIGLSGALDRVRITSVSGTDTFDDGIINILYE